MKMDPLTPDQKLVAEKFAAELAAAWDAIKPAITGKLFPHAQAIIKAKLSVWLNESEPLLNATPITPDDFGGFHKQPDWSISCGPWNNPPAELAANRIHAAVVAKLFDHDIRYKLKHDGGSTPSESTIAQPQETGR